MWFGLVCISPSSFFTLTFEDRGWVDGCVCVPELAIFLLDCRFLICFFFWGGFLSFGALFSLLNFPAIASEILGK